MHRVLCIPRAVCTLRKELRSPKVSSPADLGALHKQDQNAKAKFSTAWLSVKSLPQQAHGAPW